MEPVGTLTLISKRIRELEQEIDLICWEGGYNDPKVERLQRELDRLTEYSLKGVLYEPNF